MGAHPLAGAVVAVVGASGALGALLARSAAARGATVVLVGRDEQRLRSVLDGAEVVVGDLADATLGDRLVETARGSHGRLDGVVNAAGVVAFGPLVDTDDAVLEELFFTNVVGPLFLLRRVLPALTESKGFLVNLSAVVAEQPMAGMAAYSASKAALTAADRALTRELRRVGVDVLDVRPPHTETGLAGRALAGEAPRLAEGLDPQVVADAVLDAVEAGRGELSSSDFG
ncbi:SDR family oxidoreductase [uncultured Phycicoccus sp.]|uniref:SDR family NAD(P)-dependent oxidoreductase n=1 Tax=uncultured Phycicoccus sp. TaxID=661422 RepID=UPI0026036270|nr:SDR family oxidoreductase [uncultured Phycicoccus sp.]